MKRAMKFRQWIDGWHYWGFIDGKFIPPATMEDMVIAEKYSHAYTGLKDEDGKEIYEGDILECPETVSYPSGGGKCTKYSRRYLIEWNDGYDPSQYEIKEYGFEVIGNIYENKELLSDGVRPK